MVFHLEAGVSVKAICPEEGGLYFPVRRTVCHRTCIVCPIWLMAEAYTRVMAERTCFPLHAQQSVD